MEKEKDKEDYTASVAKMCRATDAVYSFCLSPRSVAGQPRVLSSPPCFHTFYKSFPTLYISLICTEKFLPLCFIHFLCASGTELCQVKIGNTTVPTKWQGMLCTHPVQSRVHTVYTYMYHTYCTHKVYTT